MLQNIPKELQELDQWVCAGENKEPLNPRTGNAASVTNPSTWGTFEQAKNAGYKHIGFVLTKNDPYVIIDLDDPYTKTKKDGSPKYTRDECDAIRARQEKVREYCSTYEELSQSGKGLHLIGYGSIPSGRNRDEIEVYSDSRHIICTGNTHSNKPFANLQDIVDILYKEMAPYETADLVQIDGLLPDEEIFELASNAANSEKFNKLCCGDWEKDYESQSEADFALLSILAFYTQDNEQVRRLFRMSALGRREKAIKNNTYLNFALRKIRANQPPPVNTQALDAFTEAMLKQAKEQEQEEKPTFQPVAQKPITFPPGLVGKIADYIYRSAIRPVPEIALGAAICLTSGVIGRSYNISGSGLNQYVIVLAKTGSGKEGGANGIDALVSAIRQQVPMADKFLGPGAFASGQALVRVLDEKQCFVSVLGEFGLTLQQLCDPRANSNQIMLRKVLLDLYSKSGPNKILRPSVYSDTDKNTEMIKSPNITIFGESTPETFYEGLDQSHIAEGLIPRFSILEYNGKRPPRNKNAFFPPEEDLAHEFGELVNIGLSTEQNNTSAPVQIDNEAIALFDQFDQFADDKINQANAEVDMQLWNRAHLKALKIAGLIGVGVNPHQPIVTKDIAIWAIEFITNDINCVVSKFRDGDVGRGETKQESDMRKAIHSYLEMGDKDRRKYKIPEALVDKAVVPYAYISRRLRQRASFKNDRKGANAAIQSMLDDLVKAEILQLIPKPQARSEYGANTDLYVLGSHW